MAEVRHSTADCRAGLFGVGSFNVGHQRLVWPGCSASGWSACVWAQRTMLDLGLSATVGLLAAGLVTMGVGTCL